MAFLFVIGSALSLSLSAAALPSTLLDPYLRIQTALASDKLDGVKQDAAALASAATALGATGKSLLDASRQMERFRTIDDARAAFSNLTDALLAFSKATGSTTPTDVKTAWCPMQKRSWLQKGEGIRNPYYGSEMLTCGEIKK